MSATTRESLLANIKTTLEGVSALETVEVDRKTPVDANITLPAAIVRTISTTQDFEHCTNLEFYLIDVDVEVVTQGDDGSATDAERREALLTSIHTAMMSDQTRGGYSVWTRLNGIDMHPEMDLATDTKGVIMHYNFAYEQTIS